MTQKINCVAQAKTIITDLIINAGGTVPEEGFWSNGSTFEELSDAFPELFEVAEEVGGEGKGDHRHIVFKILADEKFYIKFTGHYDSWNGTEWNNEFKITVPEERKVIVYVNI